MKHHFLFIVTSFLILSCASEKKTDEQAERSYFIEQTLSFYNPFEASYGDNKMSDSFLENWIRQPKNLVTVHETFKKIGYNNLVEEYALENYPLLGRDFVYKPLAQIIDSLTITYQQDSITSTYYREFWQRRAKEKNNEVVYKILTEIRFSLLDKKETNYTESLTNDTLYNLVLIDNLKTTPTNEEAMQHFEYLKSIGMHGSANNLLFQCYLYQDIEWDKALLLKGLKTSAENCCPNPWIMDDTK